MRLQCFRCGQILSGKEDTHYEVSECPKCKELGVVDFDLACDLLNDLVVREVWFPKTQENENDE